jgi:hypothetical protein
MSFAGADPHYQPTASERVEFERDDCAMCDAEFGKGLAALLSIPVGFLAAVVTNGVLTVAIWLVLRVRRHYSGLRIGPPVQAPACMR